MSTKPSRLGKGLSALMGDYATETVETKSADSAAPSRGDIALKDIVANPAQPRKSFSNDELETLANSIKEKGVLQPILVRKNPENTNTYQIVAGERRFRAAQKADLSHIPAIIRELDDLAVLEIAIVENIQRENLTAIEEAESYQALMDRFGRTQAAIAKSVGKSRVHVTNMLRLLKFSDEVIELLRDGKVSAGMARAALQSDDPDALVLEAVDRGWSVREVERQARGQSSGKVSPKVAEQKDVNITALETELTRKLGLDVVIAPKKGSKGDIKISYRTLDQLDDIVAKLKG